MSSSRLYEDWNAFPVIDYYEFTLGIFSGNNLVTVYYNH